MLILDNSPNLAASVVGVKASSRSFKISKGKEMIIFVVIIPRRARVRPVIGLASSVCATIFS